MLDLLHNLHLHIDFLVKNTILHKSSLLELFCSIWNAIVLICNFIDNSKSSLADGSNFVVFSSSLPFPDMSA
jgi:hypothetical protein